MSQDNPRNTRLSQILLFGSLVGFGLGTLGFMYGTSKRSDLRMEPGYLDPSKLEIKLEDTDGNREFEVVATYDGEPYMLILDEWGKPKFQGY